MGLASEKTNIKFVIYLKEVKKTYFKKYEPRAILGKFTYR
jgi:hypothetical protein